MRTKILNARLKKNIHFAAELIRRGELVAFPTETVYGLGANATDEQAVAKIFLAKNRPASDPLIVHVCSVDMLNSVVISIPFLARKLMDRFWPGPLTLVMLKKDCIPENVTAGLTTVAVRMPANDIALGLIREAGLPVAAPSANSFGRTSPTCAEHVMEDLGGRIPLILDGGQTQIGIESTVLDLTVDKPVLLRPGGISLESLGAVVGEIIVGGEKDKHLKSPGLMRRHYSPKAKLLLFSGKNLEKIIITMKEYIEKLGKHGVIGLMLPNEVAVYFKGFKVVIACMGSFANMEKVANNLFAIMRNLDRCKVDYIFAMAPPREGIGLAVFDRLLKAAGSKIIEVS